MTDSPQPFVIRQECDKVAFQNGFRRKLGETGGWAGFTSTTVPGTIHLAAAGAQGSDNPSETPRVLKEKEIRQHGEYCTRRLVLEAWDRMEADGEFTAMGM